MHTKKRQFEPAMGSDRLRRIGLAPHHSPDLLGTAPGGVPLTIENPAAGFLLFCCVLFLVLSAGCATKPPPMLDEIHQQSGTLTNFALTNAWKVGAATGPIADNWLATFND